MYNYICYIYIYVDACFYLHNHVLLMKSFDETDIYSFDFYDLVGEDIATIIFDVYIFLK